jgi:MSHA biogenesis protein MshI
MNWLRPRAVHRSCAVLTPVAGGVAALRVQNEGDRVHVLSLARRDAATPGTAAERLSQAAAEAGIRSIPLIALLDQEAYQTVMVEAPSVPDDEIRSAIRWKVKDLLSFHIDDAVLDHLPVPGGGGRPASLFVVAAQAAAVRALAQPYHEAGLPLDIIDIRESAQHNLAERVAPSDYAVAILHFDGSNALLTFSFGPHLVLSRRIEGRGASGEALFDRIAMEAQRSVDYFERQYSWFPLAKLYLAPQAESKAMLRRLGEYLPVGVELFDPARVFEFAAAAGAAVDWQDVQVQNGMFHLLGASLRRPASLVEKTVGKAA